MIIFGIDIGMICQYMVKWSQREPGEENPIDYGRQSCIEGHLAGDAMTSKPKSII
jgi:hypothetical protein